MTCAPDLKRAAGMAYRVLAAREVRTLPVEPLPMLRACRDTVVMTADEAAEACDVPLSVFEKSFVESEAFTLRRSIDGRAAYVVVYRPGGHPARLRFTLAHELGHRILGHTGSDAAQEREADCFASHLLCPAPVIRRLRQRFGMLHAEQVAAACYVSRSCARALELRGPVDPEDPFVARVDALLREAAEAVAPVAAQKWQHELAPKDE